MDRYTLAQVDAFLAELEQEAERLPARQWQPGQSEEMALLIGKLRGIQDARAWVQERAKKHVRAE